MNNPTKGSIQSQRIAVGRVFGEQGSQGILQNSATPKALNSKADNSSEVAP